MTPCPDVFLFLYKIFKKLIERVVKSRVGENSIRLLVWVCEYSFNKRHIRVKSKLTKIKREEYNLHSRQCRFENNDRAQGTRIRYKPITFMKF